MLTATEYVWTFSSVRASPRRKINKWNIKRKNKKQFLIYVSRRDNTHIYRTTTIIKKRTKTKGKEERKWLYIFGILREV